MIICNSIYGLDKTILYKEGNLFISYGCSKLNYCELRNCYSYVPIPFVINNPSNIQSHQELIQKATKVYIHPCCNIPRALLGKNYKKVLSPFEADICIIDSEINKLKKTSNIDAVILDHTATSAVIIAQNVLLDNNIVITKDLEGKKFKDVLPASVVQDDTIDADIFYVGKCLIVHNRYRNALKEAFVSIVTGQLPINKIVYDTDFLKHISNDKDKDLNLDIVFSIKEMLSSPDKETRVLGLTTLSTLGYINYPYSCKYLMGKTLSNLHDGNNISSIRYMFKKLGFHRYSDADSYWSATMYSKDFELLKLLRSNIEGTKPEELYWNSSLSIIKDFEL